MTTKSEAILSKVQKLLALAENNSNLNEAANAFAKAQKLLTEHKLSLADLESAEEAEEIFIDDDPLYAGRRAITWKGILAKVVAECNSCRAYWHSFYKGAHIYNHLRLVGRQSDIEVVKYFYRSISDQIEALCKAALLVHSTGKRGAKTFSNNFRLGAVDTVASRLYAAKKAVVAEYSGTTALVKVNSAEAEVNAFVEKKLNLKPRYSSSAQDDFARRLGQEAGKRVSLNRGNLETKKTKLLE